MDRYLVKLSGRPKYLNQIDAQRCLGACKARIQPFQRVREGRGGVAVPQPRQRASAPSFEVNRPEDEIRRLGGTDDSRHGTGSLVECAETLSLTPIGGAGVSVSRVQPRSQQ